MKARVVCTLRDSHANGHGKWFIMFEDTLLFLDTNVFEFILEKADDILSEVKRKINAADCKSIQIYIS